MEVIIVLIVFGFAFAVIKLGIDYAKEKDRSRRSPANGSSLKASELKALVEEAVEDVIDERFEKLERQLEAMREPRLLPAGRQNDDLEDIKPESPPLQRDQEALK